MWNIHVVEKSAIVPEENRKACNDELVALLSDEYQQGNFVCQNKGTLIFEPDNYEFMDWVGNDIRARHILQKYKTEGTIGFASFEGDNRGKIWGFMFTGIDCVPVSGQIFWTSV